MYFVPVFGGGWGPLIFHFIKNVFFYNDKLNFSGESSIYFLNEDILINYLKKDCIIIDIGAHIGLFALFSCKLCPNGKIFCYEPVKENFEFVGDNFTYEARSIHYNKKKRKKGLKRKLALHYLAKKKQK